MNILICGANGLVGSYLTKKLEQLNHKVVKGVRLPKNDNEIAINYRQDNEVEKWKSRLNNIDVVINAVGILQEEKKNDFKLIHEETPISLFKACKEFPIKKIIQISAYGNAKTPYLTSKYNADKKLLELHKEKAVVIRPSLIFSEDAEGTKFFMKLASLPIIFNLNGCGKLQPIHIDDLIDIITNIITKNISIDIVNVAGPRAMSYLELMQCYRHNLNKEKAFSISIPKFMIDIAASIGDKIKYSLLDKDNWRQLQESSSIDKSMAEKILEKPLCDPDNFMAKK